MHRFDFERWLDAWGQAWGSRDPDAFLPLLAADVTWLREPFAEPLLGAESARRSLAEGLGGVDGITYAWEYLAFADSRGIAHWEATITPSGSAPVRFDGVLVADFDPQGRCRSLREWWHRGEA